jgi:trigger factor
LELNVEKQGTTQVKISFRVPEEEFDREIERGLKRARGRVRMKGFRPGKAPLPVVEKAFGKEVRQEVRELFVRQAYQRAVEEQKLRPLAHPRLTQEQLEQAAVDGTFALEFEISLRPELDVSASKGMQIESELEAVMDQEVESAIEEFRRQQSHPEPAGEEGLPEDGIFVCNVEFLIGETSHFRRENLRLSPQTTPPGIDPQAFHDAVIGSREGATHELATVMPAYVADESVRGQEGICRIEITQVFRMVAPADEQLFQALGATNEEEMRAQVRERLEEAKRGREEARIESVLLDRLIESNRIEVPESLLEEQTEARLSQLRQRLEQEGLPGDKIEEAVQEQAETAREEALKGIQALLVVEAIGERENLLVTPEDIHAEIRTIAERNDATTEEVREYYSKSNMAQQMTVEILERKVRKFLRENAEVKAPS